jgi:threonine dehydratase
MTPIEKYPDLAKTIGVKTLFFKREDLHQYGSHKGRSIPVMIEHYRKSGDTKFAISSSGNAGIAGALYIAELNRNNQTDNPLELDIFVGKNVNSSKLSKLRSIADDSQGLIRISVKERALLALNEAVEKGSRSLRQSTDDTALLGYQSLSQELSESKPSAVFIGTSSGTTAEALCKYFLQEKIDTQVHIVQTSSCHPISAEFQTYDGPEEKSIADAIVGLTSPRKDNLVNLIKKTKGSGWIATNEDIEIAKSLTLQHTGLKISNNSALSVVGAIQANYLGWKFDGPIVCIICGE